MLLNLYVDGLGGPEGGLTERTEEREDRGPIVQYLLFLHRKDRTCIQNSIF